jgi:hypothetical protein
MGIFASQSINVSSPTGLPLTDLPNDRTKQDYPKPFGTRPSNGWLAEPGAALTVAPHQQAPGISAFTGATAILLLTQSLALVLR